MEQAQNWNSGKLAAVAARLGMRPQDVAEELDVDLRRVRRIYAGKLPVPEWMAQALTERAQQLDADARTAAEQLLADHHASQDPVALWRYPSKSFLARRESGFKARAAETWDAYLLQIMLTLDARGVPYSLHTHGIDAVRV